MRIADLTQLFSTSPSYKVIERLHQSLLEAAHRVNAPLLAMPAAMRSRLVVQAQSSHHENIMSIRESGIIDVLAEMRRMRSVTNYGLNGHFILRIRCRRRHDPATHETCASDVRRRHGQTGDSPADNSTHNHNQADH